MAKAWMLEKIPGTELVNLTKRNVALAEAFILNDSDYLRASDENAAPRGKYEGSTAYWMRHLKNILIDKTVPFDDKVRGIFRKVVCAIDRENSTHLNADTVGREEMVSRLFDEGRSIVNRLRDGEYYLIQKLSARTNAPNGKNTRHNLSFASKFCHYACFYLFDGEDAQDNYSIYDNVVWNVLPFYLKYYGITGFTKTGMKDYENYQRAIDQIIAKLDDPISRNGFDHLVWYYFKGRDMRRLQERG